MNAGAMYTYKRMEPNSPDVPDAVAAAIEKSAAHIGIDLDSERVLLSAIGLGAAESRIVVAGIVEMVRRGQLVVIFDGQYWDHRTQAYRYRSGPYLIAPDEAPMYVVRVPANAAGAYA